MSTIPTVPMIRFLMSARSIVKNPLPFHHKNFETKGDTFRLKLGLKQSVVFSRDPGFAIYALQKNHRNYHKSDIQTKQLAKYVGKGLLTSEETLWKTQRKLIQPAFHKKTLATLLAKVQSAIHTELDRITVNTPIDIFPIFNDLAFQTVVKALFSTHIDRKKIDRLQHITEAAQQMLVKELRQPYKRWYFKYGGPIKKHLELAQEGRDILREFINERKASGQRYGDLLDMLLQARYDDGTAMSEQQLIDEILILFVAGHETTSNALTFTAELLARHPEVQEKMFDAYTAYAKKQEESPSSDDQIMQLIKSMTYIKQVVEEAMRLYPPAYFIDRVNYEADCYNDMEIDKGSNLLFSVIEIHKHKDYWENPLAFDPDRFADNAGMKHPAYFPFGAGPRMCIGNNFAMYEMILTLCELIKRYQIKAKSSPIQIKPLITLKPKNAVLTFVERTS